MMSYVNLTASTGRSLGPVVGAKKRSAVFNAMKTLKDEDVIRLMREEWETARDALTEQIDMVMNSKVEGDDKEPVISPELKVKHKKSQIRYTVSSVGPRDIILRTPEGDEFLIDKEELEQNYELD